MGTKICPTYFFAGPGGRVWGLIAAGLLLLLGRPAAAEPQLAGRGGLDAAFRDRLQHLAQRCDALKLPEQAQITRQWFIDRDPRRQYLFLPAPQDPLRPSDDQPKLVHQWYDKLLDYRRQQAEELFAMAARALEADRPARAYQLLHEVLREDPDHAQARRVLGYRATPGGGWRRASRSVQVRRGNTRHPVFGWQPGQWWQVQSEHYRIATNQSVQAGKELAERLEELHAVWQQLFFIYWSTREDLALRLAGRNAPLGKSAQHKVVLFADRPEYVRQLEPAEPQIAMTLGYYLDQKQTAYFYAGDEWVEPTWFHEATHQLFQETGPVVPGPGREANFWILEGIALYMESLIRHDGYYTVGGFDADRLQFARYRALNEQFHLPLQELAGYGRQALQNDPDIRRLYSQSAGLASFLMDHAHGRYRQATVDYLRAIYQGRDTRRTLVELTGTAWSELDGQYHQFLDVTDADLAHLKPAPLVRNLSLGHTQVTDQGLAQLAGCSDLQWLDLAATAVTDAGLVHLKEAVRLKQLNLEQTRITGTALQTLGKLQRLEELDLSGVNLTDQDLAALASLKNLRVLWLTGTPVTDAALPHLAGLKQLETLELSGTQVTPAAVERLKKE